VAEARNAGKTVAYTSEIWPDHPEKVLACRRDFAALYPATARALVRTMLDACAWLDSSDHRKEIAQALASAELLGVPRALIEPRLVATDGGDARALPVRFFDGGAVNYPRVSDGLWFITQYRRWGMLDADIDDAAVAASVNQTALYRDAARASGIALPEERRAATLCDRRVWDGGDAAGYLAGFEMRA
jgi:nitrate/nitrite transport system substrate-binding protein